MQRENIGSHKSQQVLENELNGWLQGLVTEINQPDADTIAKHPLRSGKVLVRSIPDSPGYYSVILNITPHFQIEGMDVQLSLIAQIPTGNQSIH